MERDLTRQEVVAMWLYGAQYAKSGMGAIAWWSQLDVSRKRVVDDFIAAYEDARERDVR